ncbi:MAG: tetratricopeptide repeat protein [Ignavibacteriaceae bacterium]|nr:tetratricopeptide repeat protein [Ignavibacteriaceae bacterium]
MEAKEKQLVQLKIEKAQRFAAEGKTLHAIQFYTKIIEDHSESIEAYFNLSGLYESLENISAAENLLSDLLEENSDNKDVRLFLGHFLFRQGRWNETIEVLSFFSPDEIPLASFFIGYSHYMLLEYELARISFENFVKSGKETEFLQDAYIYLAKTHINLTNFDMALLYAKQAETFYSNYYELHLLFAIIYYYLKMTAHAVTSIEKTLQLNKSDLSVNEWAGKIYLKNSDYKKAEKYLAKFAKEAIEVSPEIYSYLGIAYLHANKLKDAQNYFDLALKSDPQNKVALEAVKNLEKLNQNPVASDG